MYHVVVDHLLYCSNTSTAQHSAISPHTPDSKYAPIRVRQGKQADREHLLYCNTTSTAQHSKAQSARTKPQSKYEPTRVRQHRQAARVGKSQHVVEHLHSTLSSQNEHRNRNVPGLQNMQVLTQRRWMRKGFAFSFDLNKINAICLRLFYDMYLAHACGVRVVILEYGILAYASRQFAPKTSLSASFAFCSFLGCERRSYSMLLCCCTESEPFECT